MTIDDVAPAAAALLEAGQSAGSLSDLAEIAGSLATLGDALREAARACDALALHAIPDDVAGSVGERYRAAADAWPGPVRPSHEQLAAILAALHDTAASARLTARRCDGALTAVVATAGVHDERR